MSLLYDRLVVLDFEATCTEEGCPDPQEIIELPCVVIDVATRSIVKEWRTYVRPVHHPVLSEFCTNLTGITQEQVDAAPTFQEAFPLWLNEILFDNGRTAYVTCGDWDLKTMLPAQVALCPDLSIPEPLTRWTNIKKVATKFVNKGKPKKERLHMNCMPVMLDQFGLTLEGRHHSGLDDSRNIARICIALLEQGCDITAST